MKYLLVIGLIVLAFLAGKLTGILTEYKTNGKIMANCMTKYSWVTDGEVCSFIVAKDYRNGTCGPKQRIARAYASHRVLNCVLGVEK